jgi:hypothetical protein
MGAVQRHREGSQGWGLQIFGVDILGLEVSVVEGKHRGDEEGPLVRGGVGRELDLKIISGGETRPTAAVLGVGDRANRRPFPVLQLEPVGVAARTGHAAEHPAGGRPVDLHVPLPGCDGEPDGAAAAEVCTLLIQPPDVAALAIVDEHFGKEAEAGALNLDRGDNPFGGHEAEALLKRETRPSHRRPHPQLELPPLRAEKSGAGVTLLLREHKPLLRIRCRPVKVEVVDVADVDVADRLEE